VKYFFEPLNQKVLIITYYWPPSGGPGVQRWLKFVKYLPGFDIRPVVLTVDPASAEYPVIDVSLAKDVSPDLEIYRTECKGVYDWYKRLTGLKTAPYSGFANEGNPGLLQKFARFIRGNFFLPDARRGWIKYAFAEACRLIEKFGIETVITTGPPHSTHLTGLKIKKKYNVRWIADFRDPWSNIQYKSFLYQTRWAQTIDLKTERRVLKHCDRALLAVDERKRLAVIHPRIDVGKMVFMPNGYDESDFGKTDFDPPDDFVITYTGTIAVNYPTEGLIKALLRVREQFSCNMRFVGKTDEKTRALFERYLPADTCFYDHVSHHQSIGFLAKSSILLLINANVTGSEYLLHGKIFEYLASGKPILLLGAVDGIAAQIVKSANAGAAFDYNDVEGIARFLSEQYQNQIKGIRPAPNRAIIGQYSRKRLTQQLVDLLRSM
jgi:glycosyltransferase involved in cell wall biosynthesis